jgi:site-specific DNA-cytosine methylase
MSREQIAWFTKGKRAQSSTDDESWIEGGVSPTLNAFDNGDVRATVLAVAPTKRVRRLTPRECERLQGFPDDWTEGQPESHRYRQMGNAVTVNVVEYIGNLLPS